MDSSKLISAQSFLNEFKNYKINQIHSKQSNISELEYSNLKIDCLDLGQIEYYSEKIYNIVKPCWLKSENLKNHINDYLRLVYGTNLKTIEDIPPIGLMINYLDLPLNIPNDISCNISNIQCDIIENLMKINQHNYVSSKIRSIDNFIYAMFGQGRNQLAYDMKNIIFYNNMTSDNTFYIDIRPENNPDSINDLTKENGLLFYNNREMPFNKFQFIGAKGCGWNGKNLFHERKYSDISNKILLQNLHKYLTKNGIIQITPVTNQKFNFDNVMDLYNIVRKDNSIFLTKI